MKTNIAIGNDIIEITIGENEISWIQRTGASITWASSIVDSLAHTFRNYKLNSFTFTLSPKGGYDINAYFIRK